MENKFVINFCQGMISSLWAKWIRKSLLHQSVDVLTMFNKVNLSFELKWYQIYLLASDRLIKWLFWKPQWGIWRWDQADNSFPRSDKAPAITENSPPISENSNWNMNIYALCRQGHFCTFYRQIHQPARIGGWGQTNFGFATILTAHLHQICPFGRFNSSFLILSCLSKSSWTTATQAGQCQRAKWQRLLGFSGKTLLSPKSNNWSAGQILANCYPKQICLFSTHIVMNRWDSPGITMDQFQEVLRCNHSSTCWGTCFMWIVGCKVDVRKIKKQYFNYLR